MRKLKIFEHISLDDVIQVRGSGEVGDYPYGDWTAPYRSPGGPFEGLGPDIVDDIRRIKSHDGPHLILCGSSTLTSMLLEHGLADEILLIVYPVLLGQGKRFFSEGTPPRSFELAGTKAFPQASWPLKNQL